MGSDEKALRDIATGVLDAIDRIPIRHETAERIDCKRAEGEALASDCLWCRLIAADACPCPRHRLAPLPGMLPQRPRGVGARREMSAWARECESRFPLRWRAASGRKLDLFAVLVRDVGGEDWTSGPQSVGHPHDIAFTQYLIEQERYHRAGHPNAELQAMIDADRAELAAICRAIIEFNPHAEPSAADQIPW